MDVFAKLNKYISEARGKPKTVKPDKGKLSDTNPENDHEGKNVNKKPGKGSKKNQKNVKLGNKK